jgi:hypothetical protein
MDIEDSKWANPKIKDKKYIKNSDWWVGWGNWDFDKFQRRDYIEICRLY